MLTKRKATGKNIIPLGHCLPTFSIDYIPHAKCPGKMNGGGVHTGKIRYCVCPCHTNDSELAPEELEERIFRRTGVKQTRDVEDADDYDDDESPVETDETAPESVPVVAESYVEEPDVSPVTPATDVTSDAYTASVQNVEHLGDPHFIATCTCGFKTAPFRRSSSAVQRLTAHSLKTGH